MSSKASSIVLVVDGFLEAARDDLLGQLAQRYKVRVVRISQADATRPLAPGLAAYQVEPHYYLAGQLQARLPKNVNLARIIRIFCPETLEPEVAAVFGPCAPLFDPSFRAVLA